MVKDNATVAEVSGETDTNKHRRRQRMPGLDRSGPMGMGSMTGRGTGLCSSQKMQENVEKEGGFIRGYGRGGGRGCGRAGGYGLQAGRGRKGGGLGNGGFVAADTKEQLKMRREQLRRSLEEVENLLRNDE